jgi:hypothetical protein
MTRRDPPRIAAWFLAAFGCSPHNEAIAGDLAECYRAGRSRTWYWWQTLVAIVLGLSQEASRNKLLAARCIGAGSVLAITFSEFLQRILIPHSILASFRFVSPVFSMLLIAACVASIHLGRSMARLHSNYRRAFAVLYLVSFCSVLYVCWIATLVTSAPARTSSHVILGGFINYLWVVRALAGSNLFTRTAQ